MEYSCPVFERNFQTYITETDPDHHDDEKKDDKVPIIHITRGYCVNVYPGPFLAIVIDVPRVTTDKVLYLKNQILRLGSITHLKDYPRNTGDHFHLHGIRIVLKTGTHDD